MTQSFDHSKLAFREAAVIRFHSGYDYTKRIDFRGEIAKPAARTAAAGIDVIAEAANCYEVSDADSEAHGGVK